MELAHWDAPGRLHALAALLSGLLLACAGDSSVRPLDIITLEHIGTSAPVPLSQNYGLALIAPDTVCAFDTYEVQVVCGNRTWESVVRLGRKGAGPGELGPLGVLLRAPGSVAFYDYRNKRVALFGWHGPITEWPVRHSGEPAAGLLSDSTLVLHSNPAMEGTPELEVIRIDRLTGAVRSRTVLKADSSTVGGEQVVMSGAVMLPDGGYLARMQTGERQRLGTFTSDGTFTGLLPLPEAEPIYPSDADVQEYVEQYSRALLGIRPSEEQLREYRSRPMKRLPRGTLQQLVQFDGAGRAWILTAHRKGDGTLVDVFDSHRYMGSAELQGRVLSMQILDSVLVGLSEEPSKGDGVPVRRLEWYRITSRGIGPQGTDFGGSSAHRGRSMPVRVAVASSQIIGQFTRRARPRRRGRTRGSGIAADTSLARSEQVRRSVDTPLTCEHGNVQFIISARRFGGLPREQPSDGTTFRQACAP